MQLRDDVPPGGGNHSLFVSGGCIVPHAAFRMSGLLLPGRYIICFWGKRPAIGGSVGLSTSKSSFSRANVTVQDPSWTFYQSDTIYCPADSSLWVTMVSGGIGYGAMLVDRLEVMKVD